MEAESESLSAGMAKSLYVSEGRGGGTEQEEDCFYDCEDTLQEKGDVKHTETSHCDGLETHERKQEPESLEHTGDSKAFQDYSDGSAEKTLDDVRADKDEEMEKCKSTVENDEDSDSEFKEDTNKPTEYNDEYLCELEKDLTGEEKETMCMFADHVEAEESYSAALRLCPVCFSTERSVLFSNRAAARLHQDKKESAISDCSKAIELNPDYIRAILRRAELYEKTDKLDEALEDYKTVLEKDPGVPAAREACMRLPRQIEERNEKLKEEMLSKLKDLGNMFLRPFGLSTSNFQVNQDSNTGSYSVNFVQNPNNNNR
ncbi:hypothetical protein DNTS_027795 [Danionella cerebrum]|uniref:Tetratricopeptide repeat protein 1 n=1 Tax=Danionella cerebrum TaxID=2873325 RepID=A0A553RNP4_9TELE|nr:hypothetical protein DNTS_027795 [Danionella translucida]